MLGLEGGMLKGWQFDILFFVGVGGAVLLLIGPEAGLNVSQKPTAFTGVGAILTYVLTQRNHLTKGQSKRKDKRINDEQIKEESSEL